MRPSLDGSFAGRRFYAYNCHAYLEDPMNHAFAIFFLARGAGGLFAQLSHSDYSHPHPVDAGINYFHH